MSSERQAGEILHERTYLAMFTVVQRWLVRDDTAVAAAVAEYLTDFHFQLIAKSKRRAV